MASFEIIIGGVSYPDWQNIRFVRSLGSVTGIIEVNNPDFYQQKGFDAFNIKLEDEIIVKIENKIFLTGYVEEIPSDEFSDNILVTMVARDKTGDLVDCPFTETVNEWKNQTVNSIIKKLITPFSIELVVDPSIVTQANKIIPTYKADEGKTVFELIADLCRDYQILPISKGDGKLTLIGSSYFKKIKEKIVVNANAFRGKLIASNVDRFSEYIVKGIGIGSSNKQLSDWTEPVGQFYDPVITRHRPMLIFSDTATDIGKCQDRAKWEARIRAGMSRVAFYEVYGWTQKAGNVWDIGQLTFVEDDGHGISDTLLIDKIEYTISPEEGEIVRLWCVDKSTYDLSTETIRIKTRYDR